MDEAEFVYDLGEVGQELAHPRAALAVLGELEYAGGDRELLLAGGHAGEALALADGVRKLFATSVREGRLGVVEFHLARAAGLEQIDDAFGLGGQGLAKTFVLLWGLTEGVDS